WAGRGLAQCRSSRCSSPSQSSNLTRPGAPPSSRSTNWSTDESRLSIRPAGAEGQLGARQSSGACHPSRAVVSFHLGLPGFPACLAIPVRRSPLSLARLSRGRSRALVWLRPILCVARRIPDVAVLFSLRPLRMAEPGAQGSPDISPRPSAPAWRTVCFGRRIVDAPGQLPDLPADHGRSQLHRLLASLACIAVLAVWADVVPVAAAGSRFCRGRAPPLRTQL